MTQSYFAGDLHLDHRNIVKYRPKFSSVEEHNEVVMDNIRSVDTKRDTLYLPGDNAFSVEALSLIKELPCRKIAILGNHCTERVKFHHLVDVYDNIHSALVYKGFWLTHIPVHPSCIDMKRGNIHAHLHDLFINDPKYICVSIDHNNYKPFTLNQILDIAADRGI